MLYAINTHTDKCGTMASLAHHTDVTFASLLVGFCCLVAARESASLMFRAQGIGAVKLFHELVASRDFAFHMVITAT